MNVRDRTSHRAGLIALALALLATLTASVFVGSQSVAPVDVVAALQEGLFDAPSGDAADYHHIVWQLRVPRTLLALCTGAALAVAGALTQTLTRNPLADPGFIGITSGAACAVALGLVGGVVAGQFELAGLALVGAALATALVFFIARISADFTTFLLAGVGVTATLQAITMLLSLNATSVLDGLRQWTVGSTFGRGYSDVAVAAIGFGAGMVVAIFAAHALDIMSMGKDTARSLGISPLVATAVSVVAVVLLAGTATAAVGPMAFVGFAAPHIVRRLMGPELRPTLIAVAMVGALLCLCADILGRLLMRPGEVEMSIVMAIIGAPLLIWVVQGGKQC